MKVGLPKGRLFQAVRDKLAAIGVGFAPASDRDYHPACSDAGIEATLYKPRSIPQLVDLGFCDVAFTGLDVVRDSLVDHVVPIVDLGIARVRIVVAAPSADLVRDPPKRPLVIATGYPRVASAWALRKGLAHVVVETHGSTEAYTKHVADLVVDCVETGATFATNGFVEIETLFESATHFIARDSCTDPRIEAWAKAFVERGAARASIS